MIRCEKAQEQLLDALYGLLEPAEEEALRLHVAECANCRALAAETEEQCRLLARAAQVCVAVPEFRVPSESIVAGAPEPGILPLPASPLSLSQPLEPRPTTTGTRRRVRMIAVVAAAAALLLAVIGLWGRHLTEVAERETELAEAKGRLRDLDDRIAMAQQRYQQAQDNLPEKAGRGLLRVEVAGPGTMTAGVPAQIHVSTRDVAGKPVAARLTVRQFDNGKELHRQEVASGGDRMVTLPAGVKTTGDNKLLVEARADDGFAQIEETIKLQAPTHMTHLAVSKSMYQLGEVLFFRALVLRSFDMRLPETPVPVQFALLDQRGKSVRQWQALTGRGGIAAGELPLTHDLNSGTYTLEVKAAESAVAMQPARRQVEIYRDSPPQLQFDQNQYRGGDTLEAHYKGRRAPGGKAVPNADINVRITVDGQELKVEQAEQKLAAPAAAPGGAAAMLRTDAAGHAAFRARLPAKIETGKAVVEIQSRDGKQRDKLVQSIPVVASRLTVDFFPEGGQLVSGLPNRVYYRVRTPLGQPVDPEGYVIILSSKDVVLASERNQGLGAFTFTPDLRDSYSLRITSSQGVVETANPFAKLGIHDKGVLLHVPDVVTAEGKPLRAVVRNSGAYRRLLIVASCRGHIIAKSFVDATQGSHEIQLDPIAGTRGVVRLTVYDAGGASLMPLAERLVYRSAAEKLTIAAPLDKKAYLGGERVSVPLAATTETGKKVPTWFLASVVNERALGAFDQNAAGLAATFYLLSDIRQAQDLDTADLLVQDSEQARRDLDLFLGTQGWRRFVAVDPVEPTLLTAHRADTGMTLFCRESASARELQARGAKRLQAERTQLRDKHIRALAALDEERGNVTAGVTLAARELAHLHARPVEMLRLGMGALVLFLIASGIVALCVGLVRGLRRSASSTSAFASAFGCLLACLVIYAASGSLPDPTHVAVPVGVAELPKKLLIPEVLQQQEKSTTPELATSTAQGLFTMSPRLGEHDGKHDDVRAGMDRKSVRMVAKDSFAKAGDHNRDASPLPTVSNLMKQRFADLSNAAKTNEGTKSKLDKAGGSKRAVANLVREFRYQANEVTPVEATLLWHPSLFAPEGKASVTLELPRLPASYRILILGHDANGRVGQTRETLSVR